MYPSGACQGRSLGKGILNSSSLGRPQDEIILVTDSAVDRVGSTSNSLPKAGRGTRSSSFCWFSESSSIYGFCQGDKSSISLSIRWGTTISWRDELETASSYLEARVRWINSLTGESSMLDELVGSVIESVRSGVVAPEVGGVVEPKWSRDMIAVKAVVRPNTELPKTSSTEIQRRSAIRKINKQLKKWWWERYLSLCGWSEYNESLVEYL